METTGMSAIKRAKTAAVVAAIAAAATLAGPASTASAGGSCTANLCSQTWNDSGTGFYALKNWCKDGGSNGTSTTTRPTCGQQKKDYLHPGDRTRGTQDWDVFQVNGGRCYKVDSELTPGYAFSKTFDRRGKSTVWVEVSDNEFAKVRSVGASSC